MPGRSSERVTLADVARLARVSKGTVSKTLNGRSDVAEDTRRRVLEVAAELGYRPTTTPWEPPAMPTLAVVFDLLESPYISSVLQGVLLATTARGANLLLRLAPERDVRSDDETARTWVAEQRAAGFLGHHLLA